jgi:mannose-6-phosphate isomerase-like protein (cupin superfamily)
LKGRATFLIENESLIVEANKGLVITPGSKHKIMNNADGDLEFILFSYPSTANDRTDCE